MEAGHSLDGAGFDTPVVFIVFSRPDVTQIVFDRIAEVKPRKLLVIADGARPSKPGESERCNEVRRIATNVTWDCEVLTNLSEVNLGCRKRIISGLQWVFKNVTEAIIVEDDLLPDVSFFRYCHEMLEKYRDDQRVSMITGFNLVADEIKSPYSYFFSELTHIWGWATWRDRWKHFDPDMTAWPEVLSSGLFAEYIREPSAQRYWIPILEKMYRGTGHNAWSYPWMFTNIVRHSLSIAPQVNLIENIGCGEGGTHHTDPNSKPDVSVKSLEFPLSHPPAMIPSRTIDLLDQKKGEWHRYSLPRRGVRKLMRLLHLR